ncbi:MAG: diguanylate cyclase, partial [Sulfurimonas sp.]
RILKSDVQDKKFYRRMWQSILSKGKFSDVFISRKKDGTLFYDKKDISTITDDDGNPLYYVSISRDITKQMEKEKQLQSQVYTDTLTKLYNRRKYTEVVQQKLEDFEKNSKVFSLILADIDHFKSVNDTYGHDKGDQLLREFAQLLEENLRQDDYIFRWGGEEFAILVDTVGTSATLLANKIRKTIEETTLAELKITASFGVSEFQNGMDIEKLFNTVDQALYEAKQTGRNKVKTAVN